MKPYLIIILAIIPLFVKAQLKGEFYLEKEEIEFIKQEGYDKIVWKSAYISDVGKPELPIAYRSYVIPPTAVNLHIQVHIIQKERKEGKYLIYPVQPPQINVEKITKNQIEPDSAIYNSSDYFPNKEKDIILLL